ncbi:hypothetical protein [Rhodanobacter sp. DHB23]|uniref:hypothetical protein n=1 Tax=Rhodanobacter sp. DHB23 TaxID=2775923 RepID=UPI001780F402|nr:hypothetical protein [Rhodanobacter sp. DHB23]MBD8871816.1 hypothetical protein [Rhodanobacter sp. DHB23]
MTDTLSILALSAMLFPKKRSARYREAVPVLALAAFVAAIRRYRMPPAFCTKAAEPSAPIAFLAAACRILSWKSAPAPRGRSR